MRHKLHILSQSFLLLNQVASSIDANNFGPSLGCLVSPALDGLATQLMQVRQLTRRERDVILLATRESLLENLHGKLCRLLVLELHAARVEGRLLGHDSSARWVHFLALSSQRNFWDALSDQYPSLLARVNSIARSRCGASLTFAQHLAIDRVELATLCGGDPGELQAVNFGAGDTHRGGQAVALLKCQFGQLAYKPRSVAVDEALARFIDEILVVFNGTSTIRVPKVVPHESHGWAEFIEHRHALGNEELLAFYRGIGHWLAIMRLLGGSDLHAENLIAHGGSPIIVDCETLFTPVPPSVVTGYGMAIDYAYELVRRSVLSIGLLPGRGVGLGWRGVDSSAVGALPGEQPKLMQLGLFDAGTDQAHIDYILTDPKVFKNHPSLEPNLSHYWPEVLESYDAMTETLIALDAKGALQRLLRIFANCPIRIVARPTEVYAEIARMLWHPVSLHKEEAAIHHAYDLLKKMAANVPIAPNNQNVITAEIADLMQGDIPLFTTTASHGVATGPQNTTWLAPCDLIDDSLRRWRCADSKLERYVIQTALVSAYINDGWTPAEVTLTPKSVRTGNIDSRRRHQTARIMMELVRTSIRGKDGSVAWIATIFTPTGWSVQPLEHDLYGGISGIAVLVGAYLRETSAGRADHVCGLENLFEGIMKSLELADNKRAMHQSRSIKVRPSPPGGYIGLGSQIWARLVLSSFYMGNWDNLGGACMLADAIPDAADHAETDDVLIGRAGAIPPLLLLAEKTKNERYLRMACDLGDRICSNAQRNDIGVFWPHPRWPNGIGGFAHGVSGIGWALAKLAHATDEIRYMEMAQAAFAFEDALYDENEHNWLDLRHGGLKGAAAWCHGSVGIGLARIALDPYINKSVTHQLLRRASDAALRLGLGWSHCACHGDLGTWELLQTAVNAGEAPIGLTEQNLLEVILTSIEDYGPTCGFVRDVFSPGLMPGLGGVAYQLLRSNRESNLPSILTLGADF